MENKMTDSEKLAETKKILNRSIINTDRFTDTCTRDGFDIIDEETDTEAAETAKK